MTELQKVIKYLAIALAVFLIVSIVGGAVSVVRLVAGLFDRDSATADFISYSVSGEFHSLDIEIGVADLNIREGEAFSVESNLKHLRVKEKAFFRLSRSRADGLRACRDAVP